PANSLVIGKNSGVGENGDLAAIVEPFLAGYVEDGAAVAEDRANGRDFGPAAAFSVLGELVAKHLAGLALEASRDRSATGNQQLVAEPDQRPLRRNAGKRVGVVRLLHVDGAVAVIGPDGLTGSRIDGVNEDAHKRPDAGGKVDR